MATGYNGNQVSDIKENNKNIKFEVGDIVEVSSEDNVPNFTGEIEKKYTNSALISFKVDGKLAKEIDKQLVEDLNGHYVVSYDNLKKVKSGSEKKKNTDQDEAK